MITRVNLLSKTLIYRRRSKAVIDVTVVGESPDKDNSKYHLTILQAQCHLPLVRCRDAGTRKGPGGQTLLKGTDKILIMLKSIPWNLEGQLHSSCAKFLPTIFLA